MFFLTEINTVFKTNFLLDSGVEKFDSCIFTFKSTGIFQPTEVELKGLFNNINHLDKYTLHLKLGSGNQITFQRDNIFQELLSNIQTKLLYYTAGEEVKLTLTINKRSVVSGLTIYNSQLFLDFLNSLTIEDLIINFSQCLKLIPHLNIHCLDAKGHLSTKTISISPHNAHQAATSFNRDELLLKIASNCSIILPEASILLADDIFIETLDPKMIDYQQIFDKLCSYLLIMSLFDSSSITNNSVTYRLNGYRTFTGTIEAIAPLVSFKEYFNIYQWVYSGGNLIDKVGIARNIISLNLIKPSELEINTNTYPSILSAHKVYEKQNLKQYIELRNKATDQIYAFNERANKIIETFAGGFQKSALAFVTLFSTIVITRVLTTREFNNIFSYDSTILALVFLLGSLVYYFISLWEVNAQLKRFISSYSNMKTRNEDLLLKTDIDKILKDDQDHLEDCSFIRGKRIAYSILWISFLLIFLSTTLLLHNEYGKLKPQEKNLFNHKNDRKPVENKPSTPDKSLKLMPTKQNPKDTNRP